MSIRKGVQKAATQFRNWVNKGARSPKVKRFAKKSVNLLKSPKKMAIIGLGSYGGVRALEDMGVVKKKRGPWWYKAKEIGEKMRKNREFNKKQYGGHIVPGKFLRQGDIR